MNKAMLIVTAVIVAIVTLLFTFSRPTVDLIKEYDFAGTEMTVTVTFANQREIQQKFKEYHEGLDLPNDIRRDGFAILYPEDKECVVYTLPVRHQGDESRIELLGHEVLHCLYGRWHPGDEDLSVETTVTGNGNILFTVRTSQ